MSAEINFTLLRSVEGLLKPDNFGIFSIPDCKPICILNEEKEEYEDLYFSKKFPVAKGCQFKEIFLKNRVDGENKIFSLYPSLYLDFKTASEEDKDFLKLDRKNVFCKNLYEEIQSCYFIKDNFLFDIFIEELKMNKGNGFQTIIDKSKANDLLTGIEFYINLLTEAKDIESFKKIWKSEFKFVKADSFLNSDIECLFPFSSFKTFNFSYDDFPRFISDLKNKLDNNIGNLEALFTVKSIIKNFLNYDKNFLNYDNFTFKNLQCKLIAELSY